MEDRQKTMATIEKTVYTLISKCLKSEETIEFDKNFDFRLPMGVEALGWPKETYIEVKYELMSYSISRMKVLYDKVRPARLIVITYSDYSGWQMSSNQIKICNFAAIKIIRL